MKAGRLFARGQTQAEIARRCRVSPEAARLWYHAWKRRGTAGLRYAHPSAVWEVLTAMGWTCQTPVARAPERDEAAIRSWVQRTWPALKKEEGH